jgi:Ca2+-binding EF-hand superfamily protein
MKTMILAGAGVAALAAVAASAQPTAPSAPPAPSIREMPREPRAMHPMTRAEVKAKVDAHFAKLDTNRDGYLTPDEIAAGHGMRGEGMAMHRMRADGPMAEGPMGDRPMREGQMAERQMRDGPMREGPMADGPGRDGRAEVFARLDSNHDGVVTRDEFMNAGPGAGRVERRVFVVRDGDGPGREGPGMGPGGGMGMRGGMGPGGGMHGRMMERMDSNHDGRISLAEAEAGALQAFDRADSNHDGVVTPEERQAARGMMRERFRRG